MLLYYVYEYGAGAVVVVGIIVGMIVVFGRGRTKKDAIIEMLNEANKVGGEIKGMKREK